MIQSRVLNIRVKPLSKLVSSGHHLNQKPVIQQANSQTSNPYNFGTGLMVVSSDGSRSTSQQLRRSEDLKGTNTGPVYVSEEMSFQTQRWEQGVHTVRFQTHQPLVIHLTDQPPNQKGH